MGDRPIAKPLPTRGNTNIVSRIMVVTNNLIIRFIDHSFTITRNHNKSSAEPFLLDY
jgi:hypothetical protein